MKKEIIGRVLNAARPNNYEVRKDLTEYAFGLSQELESIQRVAAILSPTVPTGVTAGRYNKFDNAQAFKNYSNARRAVGGQSNKIEFLSETANFNCQPFGLRISVDQHERSMANESPQIALLERSKTRTLTINSMLSYLVDVVTTIKASISAMAGKGQWQDPAKDPIEELNSAIKAVYLATGVVPNQVVFDFGAWAVFSGHPKIAGRMPGADIAQVSPDRIQRLLINPNIKVEIIETAILTGGGLGNASATKQGILGGSVFICYNSAEPTQYDPSFCKTFSPGVKLFTEVFSYPEDPHLVWYENDWTAQIQVVSSLLCKRIDVQGATTE